VSDKYTEVKLGRYSGYGFWGHVDPQEAIARTRRLAEADLTEAQTAMAALDSGNVKVFHQLGPWAMKNRRQVYPVESS
jgi:hypothetical protein